MRTPTLIGVDDLMTPWWAKVGEDMAGSGAGRMLRRHRLHWLCWRAWPGRLRRG
jgi:hypothetical protein